MEELTLRIIPEIERCQNMSENDPDLVALDWFNGRCYPGINEHVKGDVCGLHLRNMAGSLSISME